MSRLAPPVRPIRRCVVCLESASRQEMLRIVRRPDGVIALSGSDHGRGAYVHRSEACLQQAAAGPKPLSRALRQTPPADVLQQIAAESSPRHTGAGIAGVP